MTPWKNLLCGEFLLHYYYTLAALHCDPKFLEATTTILVNRDINLSKVPKYQIQENLISTRQLDNRTIIKFSDISHHFENKILSTKIRTFHQLKFILQGTVEPHHHHLFWPHRGWWHFIMTIFHRVYNFWTAIPRSKGRRVQNTPIVH